MIKNVKKEGRYFLAVKELSALLRGIASKTYVLWKSS